MERAKKISLEQPGAPEPIKPRAHTCQVCLALLQLATDAITHPESFAHEQQVQPYPTCGVAPPEVSSTNLVH